MKTIPIYEAKNQLSKYVDMCQEEPVIITKNGRMKAFLVPYDEDEFAALMLQYSPSFRKMMDRAAASKGRVSFAEVKKRLAKRRG